MTDDRRGEERAPITLKVDYKRLNTFFADYTRNISKGGTFIRTQRPLEVGTEFVFELSLPSNEGPARLALAGIVKWVVPEEAATEDNPAGMGIGFVFETPDDKRYMGLVWQWEGGDLVLVAEPPSHPSGGRYLGARLRFVATDTSADTQKTVPVVRPQPPAS